MEGFPKICNSSEFCSFVDSRRFLLFNISAFRGKLQNLVCRICSNRFWKSMWTQALWFCNAFLGDMKHGWADIFQGQHICTWSNFPPFVPLSLGAGSGCVFGLLSRGLPTRKPFELFEYPLPGCLEMGKGDKHVKPVMLWVGGTGRHGVVRKQEIVAALGRSRCLCVFLGHSSLSTPSTHALCSSSSMVPSSWVVACL